MNTKNKVSNRFFLRRKNNSIASERIMPWGTFDIYFLFLLTIIDNIGQKLYHISESFSVIGFPWKHDISLNIPYYHTYSKTIRQIPFM